MKKTIMAGIMAVVLTVGGVGTVSAKGYGNGPMDGSGTGICTQEDCTQENCPQNGSGAQQKKQAKSNGQKMNKNSNKDAKGGGLRDGSCGDCPNGGVRPLDGSGLKKNRKA